MLAKNNNKHTQNYKFKTFKVKKSTHKHIYVKYFIFNATRSNFFIKNLLKSTTFIKFGLKKLI
jgi:hypothetical protein